MSSSRKVRIEEVDDDGDITLDNLVEDKDYSMGGDRSERARQENQALIDELERKKRARSMAVPTDDGKVKARLRELGEPITLFGERAADRRDRLRYVLSQIAAARGGDMSDIESESEESVEEEEEFYTPGSLELLEARRHIAEYSLPRARDRIAQQREQNKIPLSRTIDLRKRVFADLKTYNILGSQIADERPVSQLRFAHDGRTLVTGSWSGNLKVWDIPSCTVRKVYNHAHTDLIGGVAWHPTADLSDEATTASLASGGGDSLVKLFSMKEPKAIATMRGHQGRVCRLNFHPSGAYLGSASFDGTWRLWDVRTHSELLLQEGHSKEVYALSFQDDGALAASGGLDAIGRVWDLRTGRTAMVLDGHAQAIFSLDFSPNGYQIATGSGDDTIRIWDMRSIKALHTIPAHKSNVSDIKFFRRTATSTFGGGDMDMKMDDDEMEDVKPVLSPPRPAQNADGTEAEDVKPTITPAAPPLPRYHPSDDKYQTGLYFISSGYDGLVKIWSADDWHLVKALATDAGKVMSADISNDGLFIASGSWNRSYQLFAGENVNM